MVFFCGVYFNVADLVFSVTCTIMLHVCYVLQVSKIIEKGNVITVKNIYVTRCIPLISRVSTSLVLYLGPRGRVIFVLRRCAILLSAIAIL